LVTIGSPSEALAEHAAQLNAIMLTGIDDAVTLREVLKDERITSLCLGPGMGLSDTTKQMVEVALTSGKKCVLDADALTVFQDDPQQLFEMLHENVVLTPHGGEFARLFPDITARFNEIPTNGPAYSKVDATRDAAARAGCVVLYKGPDTVIADVKGRAAINSAHYERAVPWLATAGSGDVLAGFICGLLARGFTALSAAETGAWLHVECARNFGAGLIAEDLPEQLPLVFKVLEV
ncbi:MAG: NAD(P)H-hydrate dehydratase, partial [Rhodobacteraceae bacterium]|nr:NAD(P)H-hydrate dehydratase [Paracoccaceae bacterium]